MELISTKDAALRMDLSPRRIRQFIEDGRLPAQAIGGRFAIRPGDLLRRQITKRKNGRPRKSLKT